MSARSTMWSNAAGRGYRRSDQAEGLVHADAGGKPMPEPDYGASHRPARRPR